MAAGYLLPSLPWTPLVKGISAVVHGVMCRDLISCCSRLAPQGNFEVTSFSPRVTNFAGEMKKLCAGLYLLSPHRQGAVCWTPLAVLYSGVVFHSFCTLRYLVQETNNKTVSLRFLVFISLCLAKVLMADIIPWEDQIIPLYLQNKPCSCSQV